MSGIQQRAATTEWRATSANCLTTGNGRCTGAVQCGLRRRPAPASCRRLLRQHVTMPFECDRLRAAVTQRPRAADLTT